MAVLKPAVIEDLKEVMAKILFSRTDKVTKITDGSVLSGILFGNAKGAQKILKDVAISQSHYFPDDSRGEYLDNIAIQYGIPTRFGALGSSTYVRLQGAIGTTYTAGSHFISGTDGIIFDLQETVTIGDIGFVYARVASQDVGSKTNVEALTLKNITNPPIGHEFVINDYRAIGGRDIETDTEYRQRIKNGYNIVAIGTLAKIEQVFIKINPNVLKVFNHGTNGNGRVELSVMSQNGALFSDSELDTLIEDAIEFFSMSEINLDWITNTGIELRNAIFEPIDLSFRVQIKGTFNPDSVRQEAQLRVNRYIDYRTWKLGQKVEWDDILQIIKSTEGVLYVPDNTFVPRADILVPFSRLPRIRGFEMRDLAGDIIADGGGNLNPIYYPQELDFNFIQTALRTI